MELAQLLSLRYVLYTVKGRQFMNPTTSCLYYNLKRLYWLKIIIIAYTEVVYLGIGPVMAGYVDAGMHNLITSNRNSPSKVIYSAVP